MELVPDEQVASLALSRALGNAVVSLKRFTTGNHHYVYDGLLDNGRNVVIRMTISAEREAMRGALIWNQRLKKLGLPLPDIYFSDLDFNFPFIVMERFSGRDLRFEIGNLDENDLRNLAKQIINYQRIVGQLPSRGRFGYAVEPEQAPHKSWAAVLECSTEKSRKRIQASGIVSEESVKVVDKLFDDCRTLLQGVSSTPFLHDITTKNVIVSSRKLTGIVDVDDLCYGDPLFQVALTRMALLSDGANTRYIDFLLEEYGPYSTELLRLYTAACCVGFLSELGQRFNGNMISAPLERKKHLELILRALLN